MPKATKPRKQSSTRLSSLASEVLSGRKKPTLEESKKLAASVLGQDETPQPKATSTSQKR